MSKWTEYHLNEIYDFSSGLSKNRKEFGFGFPFLSFKEVFENYFLPKDLPNLANTSIHERERCSIKRGDVFLTRTSETQEELGMSSVALIDMPDATFNGFTKRLRPIIDNIIWPEYAGFYFRSPKFRAMVTSMSSMTTRASLNNDMLSALEIIAPSLPEQKAIADVLSSLDDKIDLLQRQNKTLEQLAQTLFRQWFIEEANDEWEEGCLGDLVYFEYGKGLKKSDRTGNGYPVVGSSGIVDYHSEYLVEAPGIVTGRKGTLGEVIYLSENFFPIDTTFYITSKNNSKGLYFEYFLLKSIGFENMNTDSAVPGLNRNNALSSEVVVPPATEIYEFNDMVAPIFKKMILNKNQIRTLETLRDTLLPKLINGEVRVCYESFPVQEPYLPWLENAWLAILEVVFRVSKQQNITHIGKTIFQKICYIMTEEKGLPLNLAFEKGEFGPFSKQITPKIRQMSRKNLVQEQKLGNMDEILLTDKFLKMHNDILPHIHPFEDSIEKTVKLISHIENTDHAEEVATILYSAKQLKEQKLEKITEQQIMEYVLNWKSHWQSCDKRESVISTICDLQEWNELTLE